MAQSDGPHEARSLLPWYASGTLSPNETLAVEVHLQTCDGCRGELAEIRRLKTAVKAVIDSRPAPSPDLFARVAARVQASEPGPLPLGTRLRSWLAEVGAWASRLLAPRFAPAFALGIIVLQFGLLTVLATQLRQARQPDVITQSGPEGTQSPSAGIRLRVAFQEAASAHAIRTTLQASGARIVDGPSAAGFYVVALPADEGGRRAVNLLRANTAVVRFVEELPSR